MYEKVEQTTVTTPSLEISFSHLSLLPILLLMMDQ